MSESQVSVPLSVRLRFGHAAVQHLADEIGVDLLHIKGAAVDPRSSGAGACSADLRRVRVIARVPLVNVEHLTHRLGQQPTRLEIVIEFFARPARAVNEAGRALRGRGARQ